MRIAVFGGSFDPVHIEHIRLAQAAKNELGLDKLFIVPAHAPPHKPWRTLAPDKTRLQLCRLAFSGIEGVEVSDYEIAQGGTSYTYLTCRYFREKYPNAEIFWLVGTDMLRDFPTWKNPQSILDCVTLAVCGRNETGEWWEQEQAEFFARFGKKLARISYNGADISSTKLRVLAGAGMRLTPFVTEEVEKYIRETGVYEIPNANKALSLEKPERQAHSLRVAEIAASRAFALKIPERKAITAALFHDCAKNLEEDSPYLQGFTMPTEYGEVPKAVAHQYTGAFVAQTAFGVTDEEVLSAIRYHTSAKEDMSDLEKLIFLADMVEPARNYEGVETLRKLFWQGQGLDECLKLALTETLEFLKRKGGEIYPLTALACEYYNQK